MLKCGEICKRMDIKRKLAKIYTGNQPEKQRIKCETERMKFLYEIMFDEKFNFRDKQSERKLREYLLK